MLTYHRKPVCLSLVSTDLPVWSTVETSASLYQKDEQQFHLLLSEPPIVEQEIKCNCASQEIKPRLLWLEISSERVIMTMQGKNLSYRHLWERGVQGVSRYWLHDDSGKSSQSFRMHNHTRSLILENQPSPKRLYLEYELWTHKVQMGCYVLSLDIHQ